MASTAGPGSAATPQPSPGAYTAFDLARRYEGLAELPGAEDNPHVRAWLMDAGISLDDAHDEVPWCASFVRHVAWLRGLPTPKLPARARSWLTVGAAVALSDARVGFDLVVLSRGTGRQPGPATLDAPGHVGWYAGYSTVRDAPGVIVIGGNQGDRVSSAVYPISRVLGVRRLLP